MLIISKFKCFSQIGLIKQLLFISASYTYFSVQGEAPLAITALFSDLFACVYAVQFVKTTFLTQTPGLVPTPSISLHKLWPDDVSPCIILMLILISYTVILVILLQSIIGRNVCKASCARPGLTINLLSRNYQGMQEKCLGVRRGEV
jgi:hypothetical protein